MIELVLLVNLVFFIIYLIAGSIIIEIIKANKNLTDSNNRNDWEMMGSDINALQELIDELEKMMEENKTQETVTQSTGN